MSKIIIPFDRGVAALAILALIGGGAFSTYVIRAGETPSEVEEFASEEESDQCQVNPREQKELIQEGRDFIKECKGALKQAQRAKRTAEAKKINELCSWAQKNIAIFKNPPKTEDFCWRETVDEVRQQAGEVWEQLNQIRACLEIPQRIKELGNALKQPERILKTRRKTMERVGLDPVFIETKIAEFKAQKQQAEQFMSEGNCEEARSLIDEIFSGDSNPWPMQGAIERYINMADQIRRVCEPELKEGLNEFLGVLKPMIDQGNYQEVDGAFNQLGDKIWDMLGRAQDCRNFRQGADSPLAKKFEDLFRKFEEKAGPPPGEEKGPDQ